MSAAGYDEALLEEIRQLEDLVTQVILTHDEIQLMIEIMDETPPRVGSPRYFLREKLARMSR